VTTWRCDCNKVGVDVLSRPRRKLISDRTAKSWLNNAKVIESQFADDPALYASSRDRLESVTTGFVRRSSKWGLTVSVSKTKGMSFGDSLSVADTAPLQCDCEEIEMVNSFTYLGSVVSNDGDISQYIKFRLPKASRVFGCLCLSLETKRAVYQATVLCHCMELKHGL